jgi:REP element-mobilizing transposase RayT
MDGKALAVNGTNDHVHLLIKLPPALSVAEAMRVLKTNSSRWVHEKDDAGRDFGWQSGYGAFSVSHSNVESVIRYIANQEEHHRTLTFQEEYVAFLKKHEIEFDERYIWD